MKDQMSNPPLRIFNQHAEDLRGKRVCLIGGAGFIGHNMALKLVACGAEVQVIDGLQVNHLVHIASSPQLEHQTMYLKFLHERLALLEEAGVALNVVDARDYLKLGTAISEFKPQVIVQLAAIAHANRSNKDPYSTFDHSLRTLENALDCARSVAEHFIYFSSSMVYGNFQSECIDEDHPLNPLGIYGALKLGGEKMVIAYQQVFGLPYTIIRPAALYGPRCVSRRVGQIFIENTFSGKPLRVEGDGLESIDFTFIEDLVDGICCAIVNPNSRNQIFNMTHGEARTIKDLADIVSDEIPGTHIEYTKRDDLRPFRGSMSVDKARELIGYAPLNAVEIGIPKYIDWYRSIGFAASKKDRDAFNASAKKMA
jgi:nucleoside-diphosphate-sugar epimerase